MLDHAHIGQLVGHARQLPSGNIRVSDFASPEVNANFHLHPQLQPPTRITHFKTAMVIVCLGAQPDLFDLDDLLCFFGFSLFLRQLVQELAIVHHLAHGGLGRGRDFDQIKFTFAGQAKRFLNGHDSNMLTFGADQPDFADTNAFIDAMISGANRYLFPYLKRAQNALGATRRNHNTKDSNRQTPANSRRWRGAHLPNHAALLYLPSDDARALYTRLDRCGYGENRTPAGTHHVLFKTPASRMIGGQGEDYYDLPGVPFPTFFTQSAAAIHGAYWHNDFGHPRSHGCLNAPAPVARWFWRWTEPSAPYEAIRYDTPRGATGTEIKVA